MDDKYILKNRRTEEQEDAIARLEEERAIKTAEDAGIINRTFSTEDGRKTLRLLMQRCKYQSPVTFQVDGGGISTENMIHNGALQGFYLWLRKQINPETLKFTEFDLDTQE